MTAPTLRAASGWPGVTAIRKRDAGRGKEEVGMSQHTRAQVAMLRRADEYGGICHYILSNEWEYRRAPKGLRFIMRQQHTTLRNLIAERLLRCETFDLGNVEVYIVADEARRVMERAE